MARSKTIDEETDLARLLAALEPMKRTAYIEGWRACAAAIARAANTLLEPPPLDGERDAHDKSPKLPTPDTNVGRVLSVVKSRPGMTGAEAVKAVHQAGHDIASESIRVCLHRLHKRHKLIENKDGKWFPTELDETAGPSANP